MTEESRPIGLTAEEEARWDRVWNGASEFERRRYERLGGPDKIAVLFLIPTGEANSLGEAVTMASGGFAEFIERRDGDAQRSE
jgi:hypothetical protein